MKWSEILPDSCPSEDALIPHEESFYRVSHGNPAEDSDFFSQRKMSGGDKIFNGKGIDECIARAVSVFSCIDDAKKLLKLPKFRNGCIAIIVLSEADGVLKKTFSASHFSWWRSVDFDYKMAKIVKE